MHVAQPRRVWHVPWSVALAVRVLGGGAWHALSAEHHGSCAAASIWVADRRMKCHVVVVTAVHECLLHTCAQVEYLPGAVAALGQEQADADMAQLKKQPTDRHVRASVVRRCWPGLLQQVAAKAAAKEEEACKKAARAAAKGRRKKVRGSYTP